jgi:hypothetical protein
LVAHGIALVSIPVAPFETCPHISELNTVMVTPSMLPLAVLVAFPKGYARKGDRGRRGFNRVDDYPLCRLGHSKP